MVECAGKKILIDCGLFQGGHELHEENAAPFGFDPKEIDFLLLTHAHLDHCGRIPLLVQRGFAGEIITTAATRELARLVMLDSAHLQEEEAKRRRRKHGKHRNGGPLYDVLDAMNSVEAFGRSATYGRPINLAPGTTATFTDAGHILGSASILLELEERGQRRRVVFSGDLGNAGRPLLRDPIPPEGADAVIMETTYGDREHRPLGASIEELYDAINNTFERGGNVIIPTFALERAQELLFCLRRGVRRKRLSQNLQVFLDSPMAISATRIFAHHPECYAPSVARLFQPGRDPFKMPGLHFVREASESMALNNIVSGAVIMAGSGMATGGRVRHHLRHNLARRESSVVFVGFAAEGTLARIIIDGATHVKLFGEQIPVKAQVHTINGFSAHADRRELLDWHRKTGNPATTYLVHGDPGSMKHFAGRLKGTKVVMPRMHESFDL